MRCTREQFHVSRLNRERRVINLDPSYQREGGVWSLSKQQLFMDSLVNGYDIPKIYMHKLDRDETGYEYSVVDGKQRISTVLAFLAGDLAFADDFKYSGPECEDPPRPGDKYGDLSEATRELVKECSLDIVLIHAADLEDIEELFSRLNNGEKLNAAESRNAFGGNMAALVRELAKDDFFSSKLRFSNARYAYLEVACKLLYLEHEASKAKALNVVDLKKKHLDEFVKKFRNITDTEASRLLAAVRGNLRYMSDVFDDNDIELGKQSYPQLMYLFVKSIREHYGADDLKGKLKRFLIAFRLERELNLKKDEDERDPELTEYSRLSQQGTNDAGSMTKRIEILTRRFLQSNQNVTLKDPRRAFTLEERWVLWQRSGKQCEKCRAALLTLEDLDGDHIVLHTLGGPTSLENARALCVPCNRGASTDAT